DSVYPNPGPVLNNSAAIKARQLNAQARRNPVTACGTDAGNVTCQNKSAPFAPIVCAAFTNKGSTFLIPVRMFIVITNVPPITTTKIIDNSPTPNQTIPRGTQTILGTLLTARTIAPIVSSAVFDFAKSNPKAVPMTIDKNKPINK